MVAGVNVGTVTVGHGARQRGRRRAVGQPRGPTAPRHHGRHEVETLLGVVDVTLKPVSGWNHPLKPGA